MPKKEEIAPTTTPEPVKLEPIVDPCEDCGQTVWGKD